MNNRKRQSKTQENAQVSPSGNSPILLDRKKLLRLLANANAQSNLSSLRKKTAAIKRVICSENNGDNLHDADANGNAISVRLDVLASELDQILEARTIERARHYLKRLE